MQICCIIYFLHGWRNPEMFLYLLPNSPMFSNCSHSFIKLMFCFLLLMPAFSARAQELKFNHITAEQGLSMGVVNCLIQDSYGFMWFGTQDGLNKYDGYTITVYKNNPLDSNSLSNNFIYSLYEDNEGILWIGTNGGGLDAFNLNTGRFRHFTENGSNGRALSNNSVRSILADRDGKTLWVGTDDGLNAVDRKTGKITVYVNDPDHSGSISNNSAWCLHQSRDGKLWIGTYGGGLNMFDKNTGKFSQYTQLDKNGEIIFENADKVRSIHEDKDGIFWIGTYGEGVQKFDPRSGTFLTNIRNDHNDPNTLANDRVTHVTEDEKGVLWIATYGGGIDQYFKSTGRIRHFMYDEKNSNSISSNQIKYVFHDRVGSVWIGTEGGGVNTYFRASSKFTYYKRRNDTDNSLKSNVVLALLEDKEGLLWIGTSEGGLTTLDRKTDTYKQYPELSNANNNSVLSLCEDREGLIWVGTWGGGLNSYDKKTGKVTVYEKFRKSTSNATIICVMQDSKGLIWIGTYGGGVFSYDKDKKLFINYTTDEGLASNNIYTIFEDRRGEMWIGTEGGGVNVLNVSTGHVKVYAHDDKANSISSNSVNNVYEDAEGNLWFATANGLNKLNRKTEHFDHFFEKDGLPNDYIYCVMPDKSGNLWMSTNKGVSRFNTRTRNENGSAFRNFDVNDGLQGLEHNQGAFFRSASGEMFVGGVNGFNTFIPERILDNPNIPVIRITSYKRFGQEVALDTMIYHKSFLDLSWRQNFFSFEFAALDFQMPGKNKYSYKLEGVDENWSPPSTQRYASYTELKGGDYVLRVRAANNDGIWNNDGITLYIHIQPPFWQTRWFYVLCALLVVAAFWGFLKYRTGAIKRENKILEEKVEARTKELAQKNKDITSSIQYAKRIQLAILPPLEQIAKHFPHYFVVYKPKDIVSGDFYWFGIKDGRKIIAAVDCTGHGVPGAFMSMIGHNLLNQIISENGITQPDQILNALHRGVQAALKQGSNVVDTSDGMDMAICSISADNTELEFAGAYRPLYILNKEKFQRIDADKFPIGGSQLDVDRKFSVHKVALTKGDTIYMTSDGYADQFGGEKGKKFMVKRLNELLVSIQGQTMEEQGATLERTFEAWKGGHQQIDDILVIGIRV
jgi:ligand-binding sensor domain-containing protein/serine phosphatase RsbU (regulator of sigma subunit)